MSDTALITETILDGDALDPEAFARLYTEYVRTEAIFGTVPMEVNDADGTLTVTIHDPLETTGEDDGQIRTRAAELGELYGVPKRLLPSDLPDRDTQPGTATGRGSWE